MWFPRLMRQNDKLKRENFKDEMGICTECNELTPVVDPCCDGAVSYQGDTYTRADFDSN